MKTPFGFKWDFWCSHGKFDFRKIYPLPWMNYRVISYIEKFAVPGAKIFEYGSGASTKYWISRGCSVISVEHDPEFFNKMALDLSGECDYRLIEPEVASGCNSTSAASPDSYCSSDFNGYSFESYVKAIDDYPDGFFDIVVVDGRARPSCIKHAIPKVKSGGAIVLDNSDRQYYLERTIHLFENWPRKTFRGTVRGLLHQEQTTVFHRP